MKNYCFQCMPSKFHAARQTRMSLKASFRSVLLNKVPGPYWLTKAWISSTEQYDSEYVLESMKSLMLRPIGAERWWMTCHPPSCLGTGPNPEVQKLLSRGVGNGPKFILLHILFECCIRPLMYRCKFFCQVSKLWAITTNHITMLQVIDKLLNKGFVGVISLIT